jgi:8-oxo-dGTP pyrophosphatase MutT (NUDIX family)
MDSIWKPHVTVAALIEQDGRFLMVEEEVDAGVEGAGHEAVAIRYNQPAGHLEPGESLVDACARETLEETAWQFEPQQLVGIYQWRPAAGDLTYLRFTFCGSLGHHHPDRALDQGIVRALWLTAAELEATQASHRSPLVMQCVADYLSGRRFPLDLIRHYS